MIIAFSKTSENLGKISMSIKDYSCAIHYDNQFLHLIRFEKRYCKM